MSMRHCLVVDDDADFRAVLSTSLTRRGYRVSTAANTISALALAAEDRPDDVVLDLRLGEDSGLEVVAPAIAANIHGHGKGAVLSAAMSGGQATTAHTFGHIGRIKPRLFRARFDLAAQIGRHIARAVHHLFMGENLGLHKGADG